MNYQISTEQFRSSKMFDTKGKFYHKTGNRFKLFPFVTSPTGGQVLDLKPLVGTFLCMIEEKKAAEITAPELSALLREDTEIEVGQESLFDEMVRQLFFDASGKVRPLNLEMLEQRISIEPSENRTAEYLVDILGDRKILRAEIERAKQKALSTSNVLEKLVLSKLKYVEREAAVQDLPYFRITNSLKDSFEEDFKYVLESPKRSREYLVSLLELYFFTYTAQTSLQLNRFLDGEREENIPLFFCLEWEKTSQSRKCYTDGWQKLQNAIEKIFAHAVVLEILNQTEPGSELVDYIRIGELARNNADDREIARQVDEITACYRNAITDCPEMNELQKSTTHESAAADAVHYLFNSVQTQFEIVRTSPYRHYADKFENYCHKFLKNRGRSGLMLNLTEESLIFITKLCIKNQEQIRLREVFSAFEKRGIFLDRLSKEQVATYYEKLNLIEKKSDSGDAKYVKRIL